MLPIQKRFAELTKQAEPILDSVMALLTAQHYRGQLSAEQVKALCQQHQTDSISLALASLPLAACYAVAPISQFFVGAIAIGQSGNFYFGANQEFAHQAIAQTVHAEQSAISHAWLAGEASVTDVVVNYTPCGHCRQFMNELNSADTLHIHLPHSQHNPLHRYLPDAFGPKDLNIAQVLFDPQPASSIQHSDPLIQAAFTACSQAAFTACSQAYAPYSHSASAVALQAGEQIITGRYAENAAFNPSMLPLQSALNYLRLQGLDEKSVSRIVFVEHKSALSHFDATNTLAKQLFGLSLESFFL